MRYAFNCVEFGSQNLVRMNDFAPRKSQLLDVEPSREAQTAKDVVSRIARM